MLVEPDIGSWRRELMGAATVPSGDRFGTAPNGSSGASIGEPPGSMEGGGAHRPLSDASYELSQTVADTTSERMCSERFELTIRFSEQHAMIRTILVSGAVLGFLSASAMAQTATDAAAPLTTPDFITAASQSDAFEIQEGKMAQKMGSTAAVRQFGAKMVRDHTQTTASLKKAIAKGGMAVPPPPPLRPDQEQMVSQLQGLSGTDFDKAYLTQQIQSHQEALQLQSSYAKGGDVPAIKTAARRAVPIVTMHLKMAQKMGGM